MRPIAPRHSHTPPTLAAVFLLACLSDDPPATEPLLLPPGGDPTYTDPVLPAADPANPPSTAGHVHIAVTVRPDQLVIDGVPVAPLPATDVTSTCTRAVERLREKLAKAAELNALRPDLAPSSERVFLEHDRGARPEDLGLALSILEVTGFSRAFWAVAPRDLGPDQLGYEVAWSVAQASDDGGTHELVVTDGPEPMRRTWPHVCGG